MSQSEQIVLNMELNNNLSDSMGTMISVNISEDDKDLQNDNHHVACVGNTKEKAASASPLQVQQEVCFICQEKEVADADCKICHNIRTYYSKAKDEQMQNVDKNGGDEDVTVNISFPGPCIVKRNRIYGNYVVAARTIEAGEMIISEKPINIGPYCPPDMLPLCLSCTKDIGVSSKCSICRWPVCGIQCEKFHLHADNECPIFAKNNTRTKGMLNEYFSVEALRALLLRKKDPNAWNRILEFEPHINSRSLDYKAKAMTDFIIDFIRNKCNLAEEFSSEIIDHVVGVLSINTFWAWQDLNRYASCLFDKATLFSHDCDPNTSRKLVFLGANDDDDEKTDVNDPSIMSRIALQIVAARKIHAGEMISIRYIKLDMPFSERREELKETFYFDCTCSRCLEDLEIEDLERKLSEADVN